MTEPGPPVPMEQPPDRLQRWFAVEVRAAERDVKRGLVTVPSTWISRGRLGRRGIVGSAVAATGVVVLLVVALTSGLLGATGPSPSAGATGMGPGTGGTVLGADGIPLSIGGEPVLNAAAAMTRAQLSTDATTFLVGGWLGNELAACPAAMSPSPALLFTGICGGQPALLGSPPIDAQGQPAVDWNARMLWPVFLDGSSPPEPRPSGDLTQAQAFDLAVVLRVHTHDPSAATTCAAAVRPQCDLAVVVDAVLWRATIVPGPTVGPSGAMFADGVPSTFAGQRVLRPTQAAAQAAASTDASPFLIGGWLTSWDPYTGCPRPTGPEADQVLDQGFCGVYLAETPLVNQVGTVKLHFRVGLSDGQYSGPAIVRVHTHDPLATSCSGDQDACAHAVVVDALLWHGPALGPDRLPTWIDGQSTISVSEAQDMLAHVASAAELFVRGWYAHWPAPCPSVPASVPPRPSSALLPDGCSPPILSPEPIPDGTFVTTPSDLRLTLGNGVDEPLPGQVVLEIHGHDATAAACDTSIRAACDAALIVGRVVWTASTGVVTPEPTITPAPSQVDVPSSIDGQPVLRGAAFVDRVNKATDETSFLVGGWTPVTPEIYFCPFIPAHSPGVSLEPGAEALCGGLWFLDAPGDPQGVLRGRPPWVAARISVVTIVPAWGVPFVMRVHVQGPIATRCPVGSTACQRLVVEDSLLWVGPSPSQ